MASLTLELTRLEAEAIVLLCTPEREPDENLSSLTNEGRASRLKRVLPLAVSCSCACSNCGFSGGSGGVF